MTQEFIEVEHSETKAKGRVPARSLESWEKLGWQPVKDEPETSAQVAQAATVEPAPEAAVPELPADQAVVDVTPEPAEVAEVETGTQDVDALDALDAPDVTVEPDASSDSATDGGDVEPKTRTSRGARSR